MDLHGRLGQPGSGTPGTLEVAATYATFRHIDDKTVDGAIESVPHPLREQAPEKSHTLLNLVLRSRMVAQERADCADAAVSCMAIRDRRADHEASQIGPKSVTWAY